MLVHTGRQLLPGLAGSAACRCWRCWRCGAGRCSPGRRWRAGGSAGRGCSWICGSGCRRGGWRRGGWRAGGCRLLSWRRGCWCCLRLATNEAANQSPASVPNATGCGAYGVIQRLDCTDTYGTQPSAQPCADCTSHIALIPAAASICGCFIDKLGCGAVRVAHVNTRVALWRRAGHASRGALCVGGDVGVETGRGHSGHGVWLWCWWRWWLGHRQAGTHLWRAEHFGAAVLRQAHRHTGDSWVSGNGGRRWRGGCQVAIANGRATETAGAAQAVAWKDVVWAWRYGYTHFRRRWLCGRAQRCSHWHRWCALALCRQAGECGGVILWQPHSCAGNAGVARGAWCGWRCGLLKRGVFAALHAGGHLDQPATFFLGNLAAVAEEELRLLAFGHHGSLWRRRMGRVHHRIQLLCTAQGVHRIHGQHVFAGLGHDGHRVRRLVHCSDFCRHCWRGCFLRSSIAAIALSAMFFCFFGVESEHGEPLKVMSPVSRPQAVRPNPGRVTDSSR